MTIANFGHDENWKYSGGKAGDQTGTEGQVRSWYDRPWDVVLRHPDPTVQADIAKLARQACNNNLIGYDQSQRTTFWEQLSKATSYLPKNIKTACETDCSAFVAAIVKAVGYRQKDAKLQGVSKDCWTGNLRSALKSAGFEELKPAKYISSADYLLPGDVLLNEAHHTAINLTKGSKADADGKPAEKPAEPKAGAEYRVTANSGLNYRNGAGTNYAVMGAYPKGKVVTICATKTASGQKWGRAANGYWSLMAYLEKV